MARKSPINYAVTSLFSVTARELVDHLAGFCSLKKLAWSPDVKIAMLKKPATNIEEAAWTALNLVQGGVLHSMLASLLKPIKEHQLFDLADWMRDLNGGQVPDYVQVHWSNNRVPKELDELVKKALKAEAKSEANGDHEEDEDEWDEAGVTPRTKQLKPRKALTGPKGRGKVAKSDMRPVSGALQSVAAMHRIAEGQEEIANLLSKGSTVATPKVKAELYRKVAFKSMLAYGDNLARDDKARIVKGVPTVTIDLFEAMKPDTQQALNEELKELFKNKAHVNVEPQHIEIVLRTRRAPEEKAKPVRAKTTRVKAKAPVAKKAPAKKSKPAAKKKARETKPLNGNGNQNAFPFPTSESQQAPQSQS